MKIHGGAGKKERIFTKLLGRKFGKMKTACIEHGIGSEIARKERRDLKLMINKFIVGDCIPSC